MPTKILRVFLLTILMNGASISYVAAQNCCGKCSSKAHCPSDKKPSKGVSGKELLQRVSISGYGTINYNNFLQHDLNRYQKNQIDAEKFALYLNYKFNDWLKLSTEFEYEHGGTGATMEFDALEEAGEYEMEIEQGGEAKLERIYLDMAFRPEIGVRVGRFKLHMGLASSQDRPNRYFTVQKPEMDNELLPLGWYETGLQAYGSLFDDHLNYEVSLSSGLESTGFSGRNWIKRGYQTRFEIPAAEAMAISARVDYRWGNQRQNFVGAWGYIGNTNPNRPKGDLENTKGYVKIAGAHLSYNDHNLRFNTSVLWGDLQNSDIISLKNRNLSNTLGVKRTAVGKQALGASAEVGYNVLPMMTQNKKYGDALMPFVRYDYINPMYKVKAPVVKQDRWERNVVTAGLNYMLTKNVIFKAQYCWRQYGSMHVDRETSQPNGKHAMDKSIDLGMGFSF